MSEPDLDAITAIRWAIAGSNVINKLDKQEAFDALDALVGRVRDLEAKYEPPGFISTAAKVLEERARAEAAEAERDEWIDRSNGWMLKCSAAEERITQLENLPKAEKRVN